MKRYGKTVALDGVSLTVRPGELLALLGPNGAGKTTAIGLWLGLLEPNDGEVTLMGGSPIDVQSRLDVGVMMQEIALAPELRARELIAQTASYYRNPLSVEETLALTGTAALADKRYGKLSAGQKRQVQFATTVCGRPKLLFLDEPTVGLDITARETMWRTIRQPARRRLLDRAHDALSRGSRSARRSRRRDRERPRDRRGHRRGNARARLAQAHQRRVRRSPSTTSSAGRVSSTPGATPASCTSRRSMPSPSSADCSPATTA